jgi:uncharacterized pyridoxamine 5'-phosphate oxidase family protein
MVRDKVERKKGTKTEERKHMYSKNLKEKENVSFTCLNQDFDFVLYLSVVLDSFLYDDDHSDVHDMLVQL